MFLPLPRTEPLPASKVHPESLKLKQITFTVTSVSPQSPVRYHIVDEEDVVHVFLNRPLSRLDLGTLTEIFRKAEKPSHQTKIPVSAPPSPNVAPAVTNSNPGVSSAPMKFPMSLFTAFNNPSPQDSTPSPNPRQCHDSHIKGGKPRQILFYDRNKPHYGFTNFSEHPTVYKGHVYPTSEHLFQCMKFLDRQPYVAEMIRLAARPRDAFDLAHQHRQLARDDWFKVNIKMMDEALWHKFTQHEELKRELLATGDAELVEASDQDAFWGWGADRKGRNELGKALMRLRAKLQSA